MIKRSITASILVLVLAVLIYFDKAIYGLFGLFLLFSLIASYELINAYRNNDQKIYKYDFFIYILVFLNFLSISNIFQLDIKNYLLIFFITLSLSNLILFILNTFSNEKVLKNKSYFILNYISVGLGSIIFLRNIPTLGFYFSVYTISIVFLTDTFAYIFGRLIGKNKLSKISPKKTWEGSIFGTLTATLLIVILSNFLFEKQLYLIMANIGITSKILMLIILIFITITTSILGQLGDLAASKIKRSYNIKDFGNIFPGHGGILDRFDSTIFASYTIFIFILIYNLL